MSRKSKSIIAIESWDKPLVLSKMGMEFLLRFLAATNDIDYLYHFVSTPQELEYYIKNVPVKRNSLLYLAMHGNPQKIHTGYKTEFEISLSELGAMMGSRFEGCGLHFASCAVMNSWEETLMELKNNTGLAFISGYTKYVDFQSSSIVDHILLSEWAYSRSYKRMFTRILDMHKRILKENGFEYI